MSKLLTFLIALGAIVFAVVATASANMMLTGVGAAPPSFSLAWVSHAEDTGGGTTVTYSTLNFGTANSNRIIAVAVVNRPTSAVSTISSMTIGGIAATQISSAYVTSTSQIFMADIWQASVPTGTSGNVVITYSVASTRSGIDLYNIVTAHPTATSADGAFMDPGPTDPSITITVPSGGAGIAIYGNRSAITTTSSLTWTNATGDNIAPNIGGVSTVVGSAHTTSTGSLTITGDIPGNTTASSIVLTGAAWGP